MKIGTDISGEWRFATFGGDSFFKLKDQRDATSFENHPYPLMKDLKVLTLIWRLVKIFFKFGNREVYYHICGSSGVWDVPMNAENVEARFTKSGTKITIW